MTTYPKAALAFVTEPSPGVFILNLDDGKKFKRLQLSFGQLANIVVDGAKMTLRVKPEIQT